MKTQISFHHLSASDLRTCIEGMRATIRNIAKTHWRRGPIYSQITNQLERDILVASNELISRN